MPEQHKLKSDSGPDLAFNGEVLSAVSARRDSDPDQLRWTEITLYQTSGGKYVVHVVGKTICRGERDFSIAQVCDTPQEVVALLRQPDRKTGKQRITWLGKKLLKQAADADSNFEEVLVQHIT